MVAHLLRVESLAFHQTVKHSQNRLEKWVALRTAELQEIGLVLRRRCGLPHHPNAFGGEHRHGRGHGTRTRSPEAISLSRPSVQRISHADSDKDRALQGYCRAVNTIGNLRNYNVHARTMKSFGGWGFATVGRRALAAGNLHIRTTVLLSTLWQGHGWRIWTFSLHALCDIQLVMLFNERSIWPSRMNWLHQYKIPPNFRPHCLSETEYCSMTSTERMSSSEELFQG